MTIINKERALKYNIAQIITLFLIAGIAGAVMAQSPPAMVPEPVFTAGYENPILWNMPTPLPGTVTAFEIWVDTASTGYPDWPASSPDEWGPGDISIRILIPSLAESYGTTYGSDYAYPVGSMVVLSDDEPLESGLRYCYKVRYRWLNVPDFGFSDWSETYCSTQDATPPTGWIDSLPIWTNTSVCTLHYQLQDYVCGGIDSAVLYYKTALISPWTRYTTGTPAPAAGEDYYEGDFYFDSDDADGDGPYYFYIAGWDSLGNGINPMPGLHYPMAFTRIDDTDPISAIDTSSLPLYYIGESSGIDLVYTASDTYSGVYSVNLETDYGDSLHYIGTQYFYGSALVDSFFAFTRTENGEWNLKTTAVDSALNVEDEATWDWTIYVDTENPTFSGVSVYDTTTVSHRYDVPALTGWTNETTVEVVPESPDDPDVDSYNSGLASVDIASSSAFTDDLMNFGFAVTPYYWVTAPGPDGGRDAFVRLYDNAGNISDDHWGLIALDTEAPLLNEPIELRNTLSPGESTDTTTSLTVDVVADIDPLGGTVSGIYFTQNLGDLNAIDDLDWEAADGDYSYTFTGFSDLDWMTLYAVVRDSAGNVSIEAFDSIRYVTGSEFVQIVSIMDIDGPDTTGRYTDTTLVEITVRYGDGIDSILMWDGSSALPPADTAFWVPDPPGADTIVTIIGVLDRTDGWHSVSVRGATEYGGGVYTTPDTASIELDIQYPRLSDFNVEDITTAIEPAIPADVADAGWTNDTEVKANFIGPTDTGGDATHPGTGIYYYHLSTAADSLAAGGFPTPHIVNFDIPAIETNYDIEGVIQDSSGNWSSEGTANHFPITLDMYVPVLDSIQLWDEEMTSMEYTDVPEITVKAFGEDDSLQPWYAAIFEDLGDYPGEVRAIRQRYYAIGMSYTLKDTLTGGLKTVYVAFMDRAGNISGWAENQIKFNKEIELNLTLFDTDFVPRNTDCTNERNISAELGYDVAGTPPYKYILTESEGPDPLPDDTRWDDYADIVPFTLSTGEGEKIVYGWLLSVSNIVSPVDIDTIYLDQTAPEMDGFEVWDTTSTDAFPTIFQAALGWSNEAYIWAQVPGANDEGCGIDSMKYSGGLELDVWQAIDFDIDTSDTSVGFNFSTDSLPIVINTDSEGRKDITARLRDGAGNWGNTFDPNSQITIHGGYDTQPPDFEFLDVYNTTVTDSVTTTRPLALPIQFTDNPAPGFLWKVCWDIDDNVYCTIYDDSWDTSIDSVFWAAFPESLAATLVPDVHYDLSVVVIDSAGNPSALKTADLLVIPDTISFGFTVVDSNDNEDSDYCGELSIMTVIDIANPPSEMRFGESPTGLGSWMPYTQEGWFRLGSSANGMKYVYAQVRFGTTDFSQIEVDSIILDTQVPSVGNIIAYNLASGDPNYTEEFTIGLEASGCSDNYEIGSIYISEDASFSVNAQRCDFDSVSTSGAIGWTTYEVSEEPYIEEGAESGDEIRQDARRFWAKLLDRAENAAPQIKNPSIVIDLDDLTLSNFPNPFDPGVEPTIIRVKGLDVGQSVELNVYDNYGNLVWKVTESAPAGSKAMDILWDGKNGQGDLIASGVYVAVVDVGGEIIKRKIAIWKGGE